MTPDNTPEWGSHETQATVKALREYGGSFAVAVAGLAQAHDHYPHFVRELGNVLYYADSANTERTLAAFGDLAAAKAMPAEARLAAVVAAYQNTWDRHADLAGVAA